MSFATRLKKLTDYLYSPTNPASEDAIREQIDDSIQEVYDNVTDVLGSTTQGDSGAYNIGINSVGVTAQNVEDAVAEVQANVSGATLGLIPNNTLTEAKMAAEMKKQAGGVAEYDTVATNTANIASNASNITTINNELDIVRTATDSTGSLDAYILDTPAVFDFTVDGNLVNFNPNFTNTGSSTIAVDSTTKAIRKFDVDSDSYVILEEGDIKKNNPIQLRFDVSEDFFVLAPKSGGSPVKLIQTKTATFLKSQSSINIVLDTVVDASKTMIIVNSDATGTDSAYIKVHVSAFDGETITLIRNRPGGQSLSVSVQVIEYDNVKSFQKGTVTFTGTTNNVTISSVNLDKSFVSCNFKTNYTFTNARTTDLMNYLSTSTNLVLNGAVSTTYTVDYYVVEFN